MIINAKENPRMIIIQEKNYALVIKIPDDNQRINYLTTERSVVEGHNFPYTNARRDNLTALKNCSNAILVGDCEGAEFTLEELLSKPVSFLKEFMNTENDALVAAFLHQFFIFASNNYTYKEFINFLNKCNPDVINWLNEEILINSMNPNIIDLYGNHMIRCHSDVLNKFQSEYAEHFHLVDATIEKKRLLFPFILALHGMEFHYIDVNWFIDKMSLNLVSFLFLNGMRFASHVKSFETALLKKIVEIIDSEEESGASVLYDINVHNLFTSLGSLASEKTKGIIKNHPVLHKHYLVHYASIPEFFSYMEQATGVADLYNGKTLAYTGYVSKDQESASLDLKNAIMDMCYINEKSNNHKRKQDFVEMFCEFESIHPEHLNVVYKDNQFALEEIFISLMSSATQKELAILMDTFIGSAEPPNEVFQESLKGLALWKEE